MSSVFGFGLGILLLIIIGKILAFSASLLIKVLVNALIGGVLLWIFNLFTKGSNLYLEITPLRALIVGILGPLGIIALLLLNKR
ncbi:MAG: transcriptional regulator [Tissierellia bacterium]|nr:transcriptional regulator [Tissierellia bacterium]